MFQYFAIPKRIVMIPDAMQPPTRKYLRSERSAIIPTKNRNIAYDERYTVSIDPMRESAFCLFFPSISSIKCGEIATVKGIIVQFET